MAIKNFGEHVPGVYMMPIFLGTVTANATKKVGIKMPWKHELLGVRTFARASSGTSPTLTVDVLEAGTSMLSAPVACVADTYTDATVTDTMIADEANLTMDLAIGGTNTPTFNDVTVTLCLRRTN
jgi:hypothetical protein